jgi:hypothetical protein
MEGLWMLAGRNDVEFVARYASRMRTFSDDGTTLHGAYGYRWREQLGTDRLHWCIQSLRQNLEDRRVVLQMWEAASDLARAGRDVPCNLIATFQVSANGALDLTVFCRSNDIVWGCYGANAVHFSMLLEYVARHVGVPVGRYWQVSVNWHGYTDTVDPLFPLIKRTADQVMDHDVDCPYESEEVEPYPMFQDVGDPKVWDEDLYEFFQDGVTNPDSIWGAQLRTPFFNEVAMPMAHAHWLYQKLQGGGHGQYEATLTALEAVAATDWRKAATEWVQRRHTKWMRAHDDGPSAALNGTEVLQ